MAISNNMRISGLASGMDTEKMVADLMKAARIPFDRLSQSKTQLEWQRDAYRSINTKLLEFRNIAFDMKLNSSYNSKKAISSSESAISVSGTASAVEGIYKIQVTQLAETAKLKSDGPVGAKSLQGLDTTLGSLSLDSDTTLTIGGAKGTATINVKQTDSVDLLVKAINNQSTKTGVKVSYDATLDHFFFSSSATGADANVKLQSGNSSLLDDIFKIASPEDDIQGSLLTGAQVFANGIATKVNDSLTSEQEIKIAFDGASVSLKVDKNTTIGNLIDQINNSDVGKKGVSAFLNADNKLAFTNPGDNTVNPIVITDETSDSNDLLFNLGWHDSDGNNSYDPTSRSYYEVSDYGLDAKIEFNGVKGEYATNSFSINGMNFTAKQVMTSTADITVTQDTDGIYEKIKNFVDKYNELIDSINNQLVEKKYRDFFPLSEEQKKDMKEDDIKKWEEKARSGLLRSDQMLTSALSGFRISLSSVVTGLSSGSMKQLSQIGITTGDYSEKGKLYIDPTALKKAIAEHPEEIDALFTANDNNKDSAAGDGLATRLVDQLDSLMNNIKTKAGTVSSVDSSYTMGKRLRDYNKRIEDMTLKLDGLETKYYNQFTAMEKYINQMNAQSAYLMQQFGG